MINPFLEKLLDFYNLSYDDFILEQDKTLNDLPNKDKFKDGEKIASYLREAILRQEKILIYGDYDCDGIMSTSILMLTLSTANYKPGYYIPSREYDGYGLTKENVDRFYSLGYKIIICVDNGIVLNDVIDYANSLNIDVIILDHHKVNLPLPKAKYIMHPDVDNFGKYNISAGEVSFYFSLFYLNRFDEYLFSLCVLSTLSDSMPLFDYNRIIVKEGVKIINQNHFVEIFSLLNKEKSEIDEDDLYMQVIPKINAICRLLNDNSRFNIVKYFISKDTKTINKLSYWISSINERRKEIVNNLDFASIDEKENTVFYLNQEGEGIGGLIANKLLNKFNKIIYVFSNNEQDSSIYKGSVRSPKGFNVTESLKNNSTLLEAFGGHESAAGFTIKKELFKKFKENILEETKDIKFDLKKKYVNLDLSELTLNYYEIYKELSPFGEGRMKPSFLIEGLNISEISKYVYNKHIIYKLNREATILIFNFDPEILKASFINVIGHLSLNEFNNIKSIQFIVDDFTLIY